MIRSERITSIVLYAIVAFAAAVRIYFALRCQSTPDYSDMELYNSLALTGGVSTYPPPVYPLFLRAVYFLFGARNYTAVFIVQGVISAFTVYAVYWVTKSVSTKRAGLIAAGIAAVYPNFIVYNLTTLTETLGILIAVSLAAAVLLPVRPRYASIAAGVVLCIGYLVRPAFLFFFPGLILGVKRKIAFIVTCAAILAPWMIFVSASNESRNTGAMLLYKAYNPEADGLSYVDITLTPLGSDTLSNAEYLRGALDFVRNNRWKTVDIIYRKTSILISRGWDSFVMKRVVGENNVVGTNLLVYGYLPVIFFGFIGMVRHYNRRNRILALTAVSYCLFIVLFSILKFRYRVLIEPMLIMYAGILVDAYARYVSSGVSERTEPEPGPWRLRLLDDRYQILVIFAVAIALRIYLASTSAPVPDYGESSEMNRLALGARLNIHNAPLYPLFLRLLYRLFGELNYRAVFLVQGIVSAFIVPLTYEVTARLSNNRTTAVLAAAISAVYPYFLAYNVVTVHDSLSVIFVALLLYAIVVELSDTNRSIASGLIAGFGILLNPLFAYLIPGLLVTLRKRLAFLFVVAAVAAPWAIRNSAKARTFVPVYSKVGYRMTSKLFKGRSTGWNKVNTIYKSVSVVFSRGSQTGIGKAENRNSVYIRSYAYVLILAAGLIGLIRYYRAGQRPLLLTILGAVVLLIFLSRFELRFRVLLEPLLIVYTAMCIGGAFVTASSGGAHAIPPR